MALERHRKSKSITHDEKLRALSRAGKNIDPTDRRAVSRAYRRLNERVPTDMERRAPKAVREDARAHGFRTTPKGVVVDGPRDKKRQPIPGARVEVKRGGVIKQTVGDRRDFIYGFTRKEKREFAKNPEAFTKKKLSELERLFPSLRRARKKDVRLQWGAYQATKQFSPTYFTARYFATISPEEIRKVGKRQAKPRADKLTGIHVVIHVPSNARKRQGVYRGKQKGKRK